MLGDAIRAEGYRFVRNRTAMFWSIAFVPILGLVSALPSHLFCMQNRCDGATTYSLSCTQRRQ